MEPSLEWLEDAVLKENVCRRILGTLPQWFGIPESNEEYAAGVRSLSFLAVKLGDECIGFCSTRENTSHCVEIYLIAVLPSFHRNGLGHKLIERVVETYEARGFKLLEVKTLDESRESEEYQRTRQFYRSQEFFALETIPEIWGPENPCLVMVRPLGQPH